MSEILKLVAGDNLPNVQITLTNKSTGAPIDVSAVGTVVNVYMRAQGQNVVLATLQATLVNTGTDGIVKFGFPGAALQVPSGMYEFEISVNFNGLVETVFETLKAQIRTRFGS